MENENSYGAFLELHNIHIIKVWLDPRHENIEWG